MTHENFKSWASAILQDDHTKHWIDVWVSLGAGVSMYTYVTKLLPDLILWTTFIGSVLGILWWFYRGFCAVRDEVSRYKASKK
jgi:hypothetical protein